MTRTAHTIARMEAAKTVEEQAAIQSENPMDSVFRDVLDLTYDRYVQFGTPLGLREPNPIVDHESVDQALDEAWLAFSGELRSGKRYRNAVEEWSDHAAWPVLQRVLQKHFVGVTFATANSVWGTLPLFDAGDVSDQAVTYPCVAVPVMSRHRRLAVVRPLVSCPSGVSRVSVFDQTGQCMETALGDELPRLLDRVDWERFLAHDGCDQGAVLDGWVDDAQREFQVFDCVPLPAFRSQRVTCSYRERVSALDYFMRNAPGGLRVLGTRRFLYDETDLAMQSTFLLECSGGRGVIGIDPESSYPYHASHAWKWIYAPGVQ